MGTDEQTLFGDDSEEIEVHQVDPRAEPFVVMLKAVTEDSHMTFAARGLITYLTGLPNNWKIKIPHLAKQHPKGGKGHIYTLLKELTKFGYYRCERVQISKGRFGWKRHFYASPSLNPEFRPLRGFPDMDSPDMDSPELDVPDMDVPELETPDVLINNHVTSNHETNNKLINTHTQAGEVEGEESVCVDTSNEIYLSRHSFDVILRYLETQRGINNPIAVATVRLRDGLLNDVIDAWLKESNCEAEPSPDVESPSEPRPSKAIELPGEPDSELLGRFLAAVESRVNATSYATWFAPIDSLTREGDSIHLAVPNEIFRDWITSNYFDVIEEALIELELANMKVAFHERG